MSCTEINISNYCMSVGGGIRSCTRKKHVTCKFFKNLLLYSGCEIPRGLKYAISKYGNMRKRYISLLLLPGLTETFLKEQKRP